MYPRLISAAPLPDYQLLLTYENEERRLFAMKPYLDHGVFAELRDENLFRSVRLSYDTIEWSNGADLCPEVLYTQSQPQGTMEIAIPSQSGRIARLDWYKQYHDSIRQILLHDWDPIGVADIPEAQDEYDSYVDQIHALLIRRESKQALYDFLWWVVTENMGLCCNRQHTEIAVDKLIQLHEQLEHEKA